jgi:hypothetical protein
VCWVVDMLILIVIVPVVRLWGCNFIGVGYG